MSKVLLAYKIFDVHIVDGVAVPKTLFHGLDGSRKLPIGKWLTAERKWVRDGSGKKRYISGFHAYRTLADIRNWLRGAKKLDGRVVSCVRLKSLRTKPNAVRSTILADRLLISPASWDGRLSAKEFMRLMEQ